MHAHSCRKSFYESGRLKVRWRVILAVVALAAGARLAPAQNEVFVTDQQDGLIQQLRRARGVSDNCPPLWQGSVDALMLWQGNIASVPVFYDAADQVAVDANDAQPSMTAGPRYTLMRQIGECHALEGSYFNVRSFSGAAALPATGGPFRINDTLGQLPAFGDPQSGQLLTKSQIQSAELNWRTWNGGIFQWLAGFRWVEWDQQANIGYAYANTDTGASGDASLTSRSGNNLYGGQVGADAMLWNNGGPWRVNAVGKAGIFYNSGAYQRSAAVFTDNVGNPPDVYTANATTDKTAFVGEIGVNASYSVNKWLALRAGYNVYWLSGVANAVEQLKVTDLSQGTARVDTGGSVLLHGVTTGLEARW